MLHKFEPITEEQKSMYPILSPLPAGRYKFLVKNLDYIDSKAGIKMFVIEFAILGDNEQVFKVTDFISVKAPWRIKDYCKSVGRADDAKNGGIDDEHHIGLIGEFDLEVEKRTITSRTTGETKEIDVNKVKKYHPLSSANTVAADNFLNDPLPF